MKKYYDYCLEYFDEVEYINSTDKNSDITVLLDKLSKSKIKKINYIDTCDNWLEKRIKNVNSIKLNRIESLQFLNTETENQIFFNPSKKKYFQTSFYKLQRKKMNILMVGNDPKGDKWTYDDENRKKYPKSKTPPTITYPKESKEFCEEGINYVNTHFSENYGVLNGVISYPTDFKSAKNWFNNFLNERFAEFGDYEDAIVEKDFRQVVNAEGIIGNNNFVPFKPSQSGIVTQVLVKAGQKVKKGQVMFVLEHESQRAALDTAKAKAQEAKIEASRYQFLYAAGAATLEEAEQYKITAIARHNESIDKRVQLSHRSIKAPFDGVIGVNFVVNVGTYIQSGDILGVLVNNDELFVQMNVPAAQAASIQLGQVVRIYSGGSDRSIAEGQVDYVAPYFDSGSDGTSPTNTLTVQASFPNVQAGLKPGEVLRSEIQWLVEL